MNRDEAKIILPFVTALAEGRQFQILDTNNGDWTNIVDEITADFFLSHNLNIRIKPEPTYRPFKDGAECWEAMQKQDAFGWVKLKIDPLNMTIGIAEVNKCNVFLSGSLFEAPFDYKEAFEKLIFADGEPFGMKEE